MSENKKVNVNAGGKAKTREEARLKDREIVRGIFKYHEVPGGVLRFPFKKWKEDPVESFELYDGQIYNLPRGVAKHLNENCWYPEYEYVKVDGQNFTDFTNGINSKITRKTRRCSFSSLEFMGDEDLRPTDLLEVSYAPGYDPRAIR